MTLVSEIEPLPVPQARAGHPEAWDAIIRRYQLPLYTYVMEMVRDSPTTLDLLQETFLAAFRHIGSLREDRSIGSWLFGIAHQRVLQHWRRQKRRPETADPPLEDVPDLADGPVEWLLRREQEAWLIEAVERLPEPQRSAILLHFLEGFSLEDIARITGAQMGTVKSRLHYAKRSLRQFLEDRLS